MKIQISKLLLLAAMTAFLPACSTLPDRKSTTLPIHATGAAARGAEFADRLYVTGSVRARTGPALHPAAHVDVQLLDATGKVLAERRDAIDASHPRLSRARSGRGTFVVSFPTDQADAAASIRVVYHSAVHQRS